MKFPAYAVTHSRKILWVIHQHRSAYNLWGTPFDDLSTYPDGPQVREFIRNCDQKFLTEAKKIFANSKTVAQRLLKYNGVESETLYHPPPRAASIFSGELGNYIFCPGRLEPQKRQELLIEAMRYVSSPVKLVLAGAASDLSIYESLVRQHGVGHRVELQGFVSEERILELYANALAVAYIPFDEDYGYVTIEGMLAARPVIVASDSGGAKEFVEDLITGFVVDPEPREIAAAIDELHSDRQRALQLGQRGLQKIQSLKLSWDKVVERIISAAA